jgi:hypothetical protein
MPRKRYTPPEPWNQWPYSENAHERDRIHAWAHDEEERLERREEIREVVEAVLAKRRSPRPRAYPKPPLKLLREGRRAIKGRGKITTTDFLSKMRAWLVPRGYGDVSDRYLRSFFQRKENDGWRFGRGEKP